MRSSSVAISTSSSFGQALAALYTHQIIGLPNTSASGLPGIRVLAYRAGITAIVFMVLYLAYLAYI